MKVYVVSGRSHDECEIFAVFPTKEIAQSWIDSAHIGPPFWFGTLDWEEVLWYPEELPI